jgi:hypothetical protein
MKPCVLFRTAFVWAALSCGRAWAAPVVMVPMVDPGDGQYVLTTVNGQSVIQSAPGTATPTADSGYMYFTCPAGVSFAAGATLYVQVDYLDLGNPGDSFSAQYESETNLYAPVSGSDTSIANSGSLQSAFFQLNDSDFLAGENYSADLRLVLPTDLPFDTVSVIVDDTPFTPTPSPTATQTATCTATPTASPTVTPSSSATVTPSATATASATATPSATASVSPSPSPSRSATARPSSTSTATPSPIASATPALSPTPGSGLFAIPNPFTPGRPPNAQVHFALPSDHGPGRMLVFNLRRSLVVQQDFQAYAEVSWDGTNAGGATQSSGVYVYALECDGRTWRGTVTVLR